MMTQSATNMYVYVRSVVWLSRTRLSNVIEWGMYGPPCFIIWNLPQHAYTYIWISYLPSDMLCLQGLGRGQWGHPIWHPVYMMKKAFLSEELEHNAWLGHKDLLACNNIIIHSSYLVVWPKCVSIVVAACCPCNSAKPIIDKVCGRIDEPWGEEPICRLKKGMYGDNYN